MGNALRVFGAAGGTVAVLFSLAVIFGVAWGVLAALNGATDQAFRALDNARAFADRVDVAPLNDLWAKITEHTR